MTKPLPVRSVMVAGKRTSVRLDDETWNMLLYICREQGRTLSDVMTCVERRRQGQTRSTATRQYVLEYFRRRSDVPADIVSEHATRFPSLVLSSMRIEGDGSERKVWFSLDAVPKVETDGVADGWRAWNAFRAERERLPSPGEFLASLKRGGSLLNVLDVTPEDPFNFRLVVLNDCSSRFAGTDLGGQRIGEYPFAIHALGLQADYGFVKREGQPIYQILHQQFRGIERAYTRLILPFASDGWRIDRLVSIVQTLVPSRRIKALPHAAE